MPHKTQFDMIQFKWNQTFNHQQKSIFSLMWQ